MNKVKECLEKLIHLNNCEMEGLQSGKPTPQQWYEAFNEATEALSLIDGEDGEANLLMDFMGYIRRNKKGLFDLTDKVIVGCYLERYFSTTPPKEVSEKQDEKEDIAKILRDNIYFSGQLGDYVIHGAIEKIIEYFRPATQPQAEGLAYVPCDENDERVVGGFTSLDGRSLCYVREIKMTP